MPINSDAMADTNRVPVSLSFSLADQNVATTKSIGIYNFSTRLARELPGHPEVGQLTIFANHTLKEALPASPKVDVRFFEGAIDRRWQRVLWDQAGVYTAARRAGHEWLFLPKGFASFVRRPPAGVRLAVYVHDIMNAYYRDRFPGFEPRWESRYFIRAMGATIRHANVIFTNTEFTRGEIHRFATEHGWPQPRVVVAGYGFDPVHPPPTPKEERVLLFASKVPHKRTDLAVRFIDHWLKASGFHGRVDCIGIISEEMKRGHSPAWNWMGRVPPAQGRELMRRARAVVYCSEYEGFGMPPVEAVLEGTCSVYSDIPPIREVMGEAGFAFSNDSRETFAAALDRALATDPATLERWSKMLLNRHSWASVVAHLVRGLKD